ncbi:antifreeze glycopeptide [Thalassospira lucentensis]|uniref:antifreeze glycopeptide n=1 Tax=Thalassospira lucentensis TaxID=168935 RepID=UPI00399D6FA3
MTLRSRLLLQTCLLAMMTGTGLAPGTASAQNSAPVPLFLKQEAQKDAVTQPGNDTPANNGTTGSNPGGFGSGSTSVDSFPSDPNAVQSVTLQAIDAEAVGTLDPSQGGLGVDMWNGTTRKSAAKLVSELPATPATHTARDLQQRLLLSVAALPQDMPKVSLLEARVAKLINMGALDGAIDLVRATPQGSRGAMLAQAEVNALLIAGRIDDACATIESYSASYDEMFWLKAAAMCALHANDPTSAAFSVDLVREMDGESDATFFGLVAAIRSGTAVNADLLTDLRPIDIALLSIAKQSIPESQLETGNAVSIIGLTNAAATPTDVRLEAAHKAENLGLISAQQLGDIYSAVNFDPADLEDALDDAAEGVQARQYAKLYQAAAKSDVPAVRAEILAALFETAQIEGDFLQAARLCAPLVEEIPINGDFSWFAITALKTSIAVNSIERAASWLQVAKSSANPGNDISSRLSLLYPVLAMSGLEDTGAPKPNDDAVQVNQDVINGATTNQPRFGLGGAVTPAQTQPSQTVDLQALTDHRSRMTEWQEIQAASSDQAAARRNAELVFNLYDGFGIEVPEGAWSSLLIAPYAEERTTISSAVNHYLRVGATGNQKAKTVAMAIQAQQIATMPNADPKALADTAAALTMVGLQADAQHLAIELLLASDR